MENEKSMEILLHAHECPFNYQCMAVDCVECVKIYTEQQNTEVDA